jgi:predicted nucleotidyltransferase
MLTNESVIKIVTDFVQELRGSGINLKKVILFGSYAQNRQHEWSDIDVALVADEFTGFGFYDRKLFSKINIKKEYSMIEAKTISNEHFKQSDPFINEIINKGIEIQLT